MATVERRAIPVAREERYRQVMAGRAAGLTLKQIANMLGITIHAVRAVINDPDGSKQRARRDRYTGTCADCGGETRSNGTSRPSERCQACANARGPEWTREKIVAALVEFQGRYGHPPTATDLNPGLALQVAGRVKDPDRRRRYEDAAARFRADQCWPSAGTVLVRFGSFGAALMAAGMQPNVRAPRWSRATIIEAMRAWADKYGHPPQQAEWLKATGGGVYERPSAATVLYHFDSWREAVEAGGFEYVSVRDRRRERKWTREAIIKAICAYAEREGKPPTTMAWNLATPTSPNCRTVYGVFESWGAALDAAGLEPVRRERWSRKNIGRRLRDWHDEHGRWPSQTEWRGRAGEGLPNPSTVYARFGTWGAAIAYAKRLRRA